MSVLKLESNLFILEVESNLFTMAAIKALEAQMMQKKEAKKQAEQDDMDAAVAWIEAADAKESAGLNVETAGAMDPKDEIAAAEANGLPGDPPEYGVLSSPQPRRLLVRRKSLFLEENAIAMKQLELNKSLALVLQQVLKRSP